MSFSITASNKYGPISLVRKTAREAFDLAMSYKRKGFGEIRVTNVETGEAFAEQQIVDDQIPTDRGGPASALATGPAAVLSLSR